ncbi:MAG: DUF4381 domain-containing protein [Mangrovibacterium sp.]
MNTQAAIQDTIAVQQLPPDLGALYEPAAVRFSFDAPGWKVLGILLLLGLLLVVFFAIRRYIRNANRRRALAQLKQTASPLSVFVILKQLAMQTYGREKTATLYGNEWLAFLDRTGKDVHFLELENEVGKLAYKNEEISNDTELKIRQNAIKWINTYAR